MVVNYTEITSLVTLGPRKTPGPMKICKTIFPQPLPLINLF